MTRSNWKDEEIPLLADLSVEHCVDELFRPYLQPMPTPAEPPSHNTMPGPMPTPVFDVVLRSLTNFWPGAKGAALVPQERTTVSSAAPKSQMPAENFARDLMPKVALPSPPPLPPEVREELLELRAEVLHAARTRQLQTLMLCGVEGGAGTSFVAAQLSRLLAEFTQMKVAFLTLVPSREKKPRHTPAHVALPRLQFLLRRTELPNLVELASANGTVTMTELLCHCSTADVLREMKTEFDFVVIDAPAIALYSEAAALAALMDGVVLVAQPHVTPLRRLDRAQRRLHQAHANVLGMVFNRQRRS